MVWLHERILLPKQTAQLSFPHSSSCVDPTWSYQRMSLICIYLHIFALWDRLPQHDPKKIPLALLCQNACLYCKKETRMSGPLAEYYRVCKSHKELHGSVSFVSMKTCDSFPALPTPAEVFSKVVLCSFSTCTWSVFSRDCMWAEGRTWREGVAEMCLQTALTFFEHVWCLPLISVLRFETDGCGHEGACRPLNRWIQSCGTERP